MGRNSSSLYNQQSMCKSRAKLYKKNNYNEVIVIYSQFINSFSINPIKEHLFPLINNSQNDYIKEPIFEGDPKDIVDLIVPHYLDSYLYHILIESALSEQTSRKNSMENATESAQDLIHDLGIKYNRRRQGKITQEITEIISGN